MNTIDIHDGYVRNLEWWARKQAELDRIYDECYRNGSNNNNQQQSTSKTNNTDNSKLSLLEKRLSRIEKSITELHDLVVNKNNSNGLFVFAPNQNVNASVAFPLTEYQFNELINRIK